MGEVRQKKTHNKLASHEAVNTKTAPVNAIQLDTKIQTVLSTLHSLNSVLIIFYSKQYLIMHTVL